MEQILFYEISFREPLIGKDVPGNFFTRLLQHAGKKGRVEFNPHASHPLTARTQKKCTNLTASTKKYGQPFSAFTQCQEICVKPHVFKLYGANFWWWRWSGQNKFEKSNNERASKIYIYIIYAQKGGYKLSERQQQDEVKGR